MYYYLWQKNPMKKYLTLLIILLSVMLAQAQKTKKQTAKLDSLTTQLTLKSDTIQTLAKKLRTTESNLTRAKTQLTQRNNQVKQLKADTVKLNADIVLKDAVYNECLDSYLQSTGYLQDISFILGDKILPRKKLKQIDCIIGKAAGE